MICFTFSSQMAMLLLHYFQQEGMKEGRSRGHMMEITTSCVEDILQVIIILHLQLIDLILCFVQQNIYM